MAAAGDTEFPEVPLRDRIHVVGTSEKDGEKGKTGKTARGPNPNQLIDKLSTFSLLRQVQDIT